MSLSIDVTRIVDPRPFIKAHLEELAAEFEPRVATLGARLTETDDRASRKRIKVELRAIKKLYRQQRRRTKAILGMPAAW